MTGERRTAAHIEVVEKMGHRLADMKLKESAKRIAEQVAKYHLAGDKAERDRAIKELYDVPLPMTYLLTLLPVED